MLCCLCNTKINKCYRLANGKTKKYNKIYGNVTKYQHKINENYEIKYYIEM